MPEKNFRPKWSSRENETSRDSGYVVQLRINNQSAEQRWNFTTDGFIVSEAFPDFALTSLISIVCDNENFLALGERLTSDDPTIHYVAICPRLSENSPARFRQRFVFVGFRSMKT